MSNLLSMTLQRARAYAYRLLALRSYPSALLRQKLERKGFEAAVCEQVIEELKANGYINDAEFAMRAVKRAVERGYGPRYIAQKFQMQGVDVGREVRAISEETQKEQIKKWLAKYKLPREKAIQRLERKGFSLPLILKTLRDRGIEERE